MGDDELLLVYDGECPFCRNYTQLLRVRDSAGQLRLLNAREHADVAGEIAARGMDLDMGMVVIMHGNYYFGADALHVLALLSSGSGLFNKLNYWCFRSKTLARLTYPLLRSGRNLTLRLKGIKKINSLN